MTTFDPRIIRSVYEQKRDNTAQESAAASVLVTINPAVLVTRVPLSFVAPLEYPVVSNPPESPIWISQLLVLLVEPPATPISMRLVPAGMDVDISMIAGEPVAIVMGESRATLLPSAAMACATRSGVMSRPLSVPASASA